ncbi:MAG: ABC-F family ATP-binding cassette domain-containing protein [Thermodesulfobacteriota bacterium]
MAQLVSCRGITKSFGAQLLFRDIEFSLVSGDRVGLIGPNGSGKSTLLKIICGLSETDDGTVDLAKHLRLSYLDQHDVFDEQKSLFENLDTALVGYRLDESERFNRIHAVLSRAEFGNPDLPVAGLSGGWRKRLSVCRALVSRPNVLVMDEPTNHLDLESILWLEKILLTVGGDSPAATLMVSHDRRFLEHCANRIIELSPVYPGGSLQVRGGYLDFLKEKSKFITAQLEQEDRVANKVRRETDWLSRSPKARTTKARYRVDEARRLQDELQLIKNRNRAVGTIEIGFASSGRKTKKLLEAIGLTKHYGDRKLFSNLDISLTPGSRIGLLGRNGCGKSTLMKMLAAAEAEEVDGEGEIRVADKIRIASFDQRREQLDGSLTLKRALAPDGDSVVYRDRSLHVVSWATKFLFRPDQLETPVSRLSGGEQARILIAGLMRQPADILLLDEPTNDLDIPSLDVLEESLLDFPGALVLVSHDRFLLDRVCDRVIGFDGNGGVEYFADYRQWLRALQPSENAEKKSEKKEPVVRKKTKSPGRLSYLDQREYDAMEERILAVEEELESLEGKMNDPLIQSDSEELAGCWKEIEEKRVLVEQLYSRWEELESLKDAG